MRESCRHSYDNPSLKAVFMFGCLCGPLFSSLSVPNRSQAAEALAACSQDPTAGGNAATTGSNFCSGLNAFAGEPRCLPHRSTQAATSPFGWIFDTSNYPSRWKCGSWAPAIGWLHVLSDLAIWLAYLAIPTMLLYFARRRGNIPFRRIFWLFSAFIVCCGMTHLMEAVIFWWPAYGLSGILKFITAVVSVATAMVLLRVIPRALALKTPSQLEEVVNERTRELTAARQQANLTVEASPSGMIMINRAGEIVLFNKAAEKIFGYRRHEVLGRPVELLVPDALRPSHPAQRDSFFANPSAHIIGECRDLYGQRADGSLIPVEIGLNPVKTHQGMFVLSSIVDITERKNTEERMKLANDILHKSNSELQQFAYVASHDLQEPLRKISSYAAIIRDECGDSLDSTGKEHLEIIIDGANRLKTLISDLLSLSRVSTQGKPLEPTDTNLSLRCALDNLEFAIEEKSAEVVCDWLPPIMADQSQLSLLFQNLVGNALKYSGERRPTVYVGYRDQEDRCEIFVRDNGIGIESQHYVRIFEIFQRLHNRRDYAGTGIGLALCKRIVERFGGRIRVESIPNEGSTFSFTATKVSSRGVPRTPCRNREQVFATS